MEGREWSGGPYGAPGMVGRLSRRFGSGQEALPKGWERLGGPPKSP